MLEQILICTKEVSKELNICESQVKNELEMEGFRVRRRDKWMEDIIRSIQIPNSKQYTFWERHFPDPHPKGIDIFKESETIIPFYLCYL